MLNTCQLSNDIKYVSSQCTEFRKNANKSQFDMAEITGLSLSTIYRLESGQRIPDLEQLFRYCYALDIPVTEFLPPGVQHIGLEKQAVSIRSTYQQLTDENKEFVINVMLTFMNGLLMKQSFPKTLQI